MDKDWSVDETINQIKHLLLEKDAEIERLREALQKILDPNNFENIFEIARAALKEGE